MTHDQETTLQEQLRMAQQQIMYLTEQLHKLEGTPAKPDNPNYRRDEQNRTIIDELRWVLPQPNGELLIRSARANQCWPAEFQVRLRSRHLDDELLGLRADLAVEKEVNSTLTAERNTLKANLAQVLPETHDRVVRLEEQIPLVREQLEEARRDTIEWKRKHDNLANTNKQLEGCLQESALLWRKYKAVIDFLELMARRDHSRYSLGLGRSGYFASTWGVSKIRSGETLEQAIQRALEAGRLVPTVGRTPAMPAWVEPMMGDFAEGMHKATGHTLKVEEATALRRALAKHLPPPANANPENP